MAANELRTFHVVGSASSFTGQGGVSGGCSIPGFAQSLPEVGSVLINLIAISPAGGGNLKAWASDQPESSGGVVNYQALSPSMNNSNAIVVEVRQDTEGGDISIRANTSAVDVRGVVLGYFLNETAAYRQVFIGSNPSEDSQCNQWQTFVAGLSGETFSRLTMSSGTGHVVSCGDSTQLAMIVTNLVNNTAASVACDGNNWNTGPCGDNLEVDATNTSDCSCTSDFSIRPCLTNNNWGGSNNTTCGASSQELTVSLER